MNTHTLRVAICALTSMTGLSLVHRPARSAAFDDCGAFMDNGKREIRFWPDADVHTNYPFPAQDGYHFQDGPYGVTDGGHSSMEDGTVTAHHTICQGGGIIIEG